MAPQRFSACGVAAGLLAAAAAALVGPAHAAKPTNASVVIFTYKSNMAWALDNETSWDWRGAFAAHAGIAKEAVEVYELPEARSIIQAAAADDDARPYPDVLFGLDNVLQHEYSGDLLREYASPEIIHIIPSLLEAVSSTEAQPIIPYDHSVIAIVVDKQVLQERAPDVYELMTRPDFHLIDMITNASAIFPHVVLPNPTTSGAGINFLTWTVAVLGDKEHGITGSYNGSLNLDYRDFWRALKNNGATLYQGWGDAFNDFLDEKHAIVFSYATDPAYAHCAESTKEYVAVFSKDVDDPVRGWYTIEGIGLTSYAAENTTGRVEMAKRFIDFVLSEEFQSQTALNNWMFPARQNISAPKCFAEVNVTDSIDLVNVHLPADKVHQYLRPWLREVRDIIDDSSPASMPIAAGAWTVVAAVLAVLALAF